MRVPAVHPSPPIACRRGVRRIDLKRVVASAPYQLRRDHYALSMPVAALRITKSPGSVSPILTTTHQFLRGIEDPGGTESGCGLRRAAAFSDEAAFRVGRHTGHLLVVPASTIRPLRAIRRHHSSMRDPSEGQGCTHKKSGLRPLQRYDKEDRLFIIFCFALYL